MPPLSVLIKPSSSNCNLRCNYCFYHSLSMQREVKAYNMMDIDTLETIIKKALDYAEGSCTFAFQGGEPTLSALDFYKHLVKLEEKYNTGKVKINNVLQTNGTLIDEKWAEFLHDNNFLVGISLDGPKEIHDLNRVDVNNSGTYNEVMKTIDLFNKYKVEYNILSVVSSISARHGRKIYNFFKKNGFKYIQFIPCLDPLDEKPGFRKYSLKPEAYGKFLVEVFNCWYEDVIKGEFVSIRYFDNILSMIMGYAPEACGMSGTCSCEYIIESNAGVYPCDFYVIDQWKMGNLKEMDFYELSKSQVAKKFIEVSKHVDNECIQCKWLNLCRGGCRRYREPFVNEKPAINYFCSSYKHFFDTCENKLLELARLVSRR